MNDATQQLNDDESEQTQSQENSTTEQVGAHTQRPPTPELWPPSSQPPNAMDEDNQNNDDAVYEQVIADELTPSAANQLLGPDSLTPQHQVAHTDEDSPNQSKQEIHSIESIPIPPPTDPVHEFAAEDETLKISSTPSAPLLGLDAIPSKEKVHLAEDPSPAPSLPVVITSPGDHSLVPMEQSEVIKHRVEIKPTQRPLSPKSIKKLEDFLNTLEMHRGCSVLIAMLGHPDPDSIASALAQQYFFKQFEIQSKILYFDEISHAENRALVKGLEMELILFNEEFDFSEFDFLTFVDSQNCELPVKTPEALPILVFVDHHTATGKVEAIFTDIRESAGATSSIYAEYLEYHEEFSLQKSISNHSLIATALMHGIRTDTDNLLLATPIDFYAAAYLRPFIDRDLLRTVSKQSVTSRTMDIIKEGLNNKIIKGTFLLAGVGFVREEDRDGIAQTADFLLRHEGVETALVFGIVNGDVVDGSMRTSSATIDPDRWLKNLFGQDSTGRHYGGGRRNKGGFRIPLGLLALSPNRSALWTLGEQTIHDLVFDKIGEKKQEQKD